MTLKVLYMCQIEPSLCLPAFPSCEPSPAILAARTASWRGREKARSCARPVGSPGASVCATRPEGVEPGDHSGRKSGVHCEIAPQLDPASAPNRAPARRANQCVGGRSAAPGLTRRFRPWLTLRLRRGIRCGCKPSEIVWRRKKWPMLTACSCLRYGLGPKI